MEAQANRDQRALDLGFEAQQDPVAGHIQMQEQFKLQQQKQAQESQARLLAQYNGQGQNGQPTQPQGPPPVTWSPEDQEQLNAAGQIMADATKQYQQGDMPLEAYYSMRQPAQQKFDQLTQKQRAFQQQQEDQQAQAKLKQGQQQAGMQAATGNALATHAMTVRDILSNNGIPDGTLAMDKNGKLYDPLEHRAKMAVDLQKEQNKKDAAAEAARVKASERADELATKAEDLATKQRADSYRHHLDKVESEIDKWDPLGKNVGQKRPDWHADPTSEASRRADSEMDHVQGKPAGTTFNERMKKDSASKTPSQAEPRDEAGGPAGPLVPPSPQLAQRQTQLADTMAEKVKQLGLPTEHTAQVMSALTGLKELNSAHGGNLNTAPPAIKEQAQKYRDILLKYGPRPKPLSSIERETGGFFSGGKQ